MKQVSKCSVDGCDRPRRWLVSDPEPHACRQCAEHCELAAYIARVVAAACERERVAEVAS